MVRCRGCVSVAIVAASLLGAAASVSCALPMPGVMARPSSYPVREVTSRNGAWLFQREGARPDEWKTVPVPSGFEQHEGIEFDGAGWYRQRIEPFVLPPGKRVLLHLQAAATEAAVWWNGEKPGTHAGAWCGDTFE